MDLLDGRPIVLVVEDDAVTRHAAIEMVEEAGFTAMEAVDGWQAIRLLEGVPGIRAVLTDIDMPAGISGINLTACIRARWPGVGVVVVSGLVLPVPGDIPDHELCYFFAKPYLVEAVVGALARIMALTDARAAAPA